MRAAAGVTLGLLIATLLGCEQPRVVAAQRLDAAYFGTPDGALASDRASADRFDGSAAEDVPVALDAVASSDAWQVVDAAFDRFQPKDTGVASDAEATTDAVAPEDAGPGRLFSFAIVTDLHVGESVDDYGTPGYDDSGGADDAQTANLALAVNRINASVSQYDIAFVMVLGDNGDSGERSEIAMSRALLDQLAVPYFPLIGNHDMWPHTASSEAPSPLGDRYFETIFGPRYQTLAAAFPSLERAPTPVLNPTTGLVSSFINFGFDYRGYHFVALDLVTREHGLLGFPGVLTSADLHDFSGGTWPWLTGYLAQLSALGDHNVLIFCHHPPIVDSLGIDGLTLAEQNQIDDFIRDNGYANNIYGFFSGHHHLNYTLTRYQGQRIVATADCAGSATVRVVQIYGNGMIDIDTFLR